MLARSSGLRMPPERSGPLRVVRAVQTIVMGALLVVFVAGAFAGR